MFGLGAVLVVAPLLAAIYGIATGNFFLGDQGQGITLLITLGLGMFTAMSFYAARKIDASNAKEKVQEEVVVPKKQKTVGTKEGFVHP